MSKPLARFVHPVTDQKVTRCSVHFWVKLRVGEQCRACLKQAQKRLRRLMKGKLKKRPRR